MHGKHAKNSYTKINILRSEQLFKANPSLRFESFSSNIEIVFK